MGYGLKLSWREVVFRSVLPVETNMQKGMAVSLVASDYFGICELLSHKLVTFMPRIKIGRGTSGSFPHSKYILIQIKKREEA